MSEISKITVDGETYDIKDETARSQLNNLNTGADGKSAYQIALDNGFVGTEQEWLASLKGEDGVTPVKGVDYFTESDKNEIVQSVIDHFGGSPINGYVDENNNIIVSSRLADGKYFVKYEMEDGTTVDIGELTLTTNSSPTYINQIPLSTDENGNPYNNGQGWKTGYRLSGSSGGESEQTGTEVTGFIPVKYGDTVYFKGIVDDGTHIIALYNATRGKIVALSSSQLVTLDGNVASLTIPNSTITDASFSTDYAYIRVSATEITADSIITVNEPIE